MECIEYVRVACENATYAICNKSIHLNFITRCQC